MAAAITTHGSSDDVSDSHAEHSSMNISIDQYNHLMSLLGKSSHDTSASHKTEEGDTHGHALLAGTICLLSNFTSNWLLDSGATDHICCHLDWFTEYNVMSGHDNHITIPDDSRVKVLHTGSITLANGITLSNVTCARFSI